MIRMWRMSGIVAVLIASLLLPGVAWTKALRWGDTGKVSAVTLSSQTIVVEIPRGTQNLTLGAVVKPDAVIQEDGKKIGLSDIRVGDRVRIEWVRTESGDEAHKITVLERAKE